MCALALWPVAGVALDLAPPGARLVREVVDQAGSLAMPSRPFSVDDPVETEAGAIRRTAYRLVARSVAPQQVVNGVRARLEEAGYDVVFTCSDRDCGGFDFRFQLSLIPAPDMYVDLGDYAYLLARAPDQGGSVSVVASRAGADATLHITEVGGIQTAEATAPPTEVTEAARVPLTARSIEEGDLIGRLVDAGHVVLSDVDFASGADSLSDGEYPSLAAISDWLGRTPSARVVVVGHTDAVGSLAANTALSERRAASVAAILRSRSGAGADRIEAVGAGYLSPIASNLTEEGRAANRRVEVVLLTQ